MATVETVETVGEGGVEAAPPARGFPPAPRPNQRLDCQSTF